MQLRGKKTRQNDENKHSFLFSGYDEGSILIKLGREEPAMSMDSSGKIIYAKHCEIQQANLKAISSDASEIKDGERLPLAIKDMGSCEVYPQTIGNVILLPI